MKSLKPSPENEELGRAIARGMDSVHIRKQKDMARETKRRQTMLKNAAEQVMFH